MLAVLFALVSAAAYGVSDFLAGLASRKIHYAFVCVVVQASAVITSVIAAVLVGGSPTQSALAYGALGGLGAGLGTVFLYRGLASGRMNVVAPLSAVIAAILPVLIGLILGERPSPLVLVGVVLVIPAVCLISLAPSDDGARSSSRIASGTGDGLLAGLGFGVLFIALAQTGDESGLWPTVSAQVVSMAALSAFAFVALRRAPRRQPARSTYLGMVAAGAGGALAVTAYLLATQYGLLIVVSVIAALYPAGTLMLARIVLHERANGPQVVGLSIAALGVIAIVVG